MIRRARRAWVNAWGRWQVLTHQGDVGSFDGHVGAHRTHGDAQVGGSQRRSVADAVADYRGRPLSAELSNSCASSGRSIYGPDAHLRGQRRGGGLVVAGEHRHVVAFAAQPRDNFGGLRAQFVAHRDRPDCPAVQFDQDGGRASVPHPVHLVGKWAGVEPAGLRQADAAIRRCGRQPCAGHRFHLLSRRDGIDGSQDPARRCSRLAPLVLAASMTVGRFAVSVPVLCSATTRTAPSASSAGDDPAGQQQHARCGGAQLGDLPEPFGFVLLGRLAAARFIVKAAARVAHRAISWSRWVRWCRNWDTVPPHYRWRPTASRRRRTGPSTRGV